MAFLSQASHLGSLLLPHDAFQEHAAHLAEWSAKLNSKGSESTCIRSGLTTFLPCAFTAHSDIAADLVGRLDTPLAQCYLNRLPKPHSERIVDLLRYPEDTVGGIMTNDLVTVPA